LKVAIAQINCTVGDIAGNAERIRVQADAAKAHGAALLLTPELGLCSYPPEDLVLRDDFCDACQREVKALAAKISGIAVVVGYPRRAGRERYNAAAVLRDGEIVATYHKQKLPNHTVFDEVRTFRPGNEPCVFDLEGVRFGLNICNDIWEPGPAEQAARAGAQVLLVPNASPYHQKKQAQRYEVARDQIGKTGLPLIYGNLVGGQDELVFDGGSFALDAQGRLTHQFPWFTEGLYMVELDGANPLPGETVTEPTLEEAVYRALVLGLRDYVGKNGFPAVVLGLSGGIDSALTLCIAVDALGADRVHAVMMPSHFTAGISLEDARTMSEALGVRYSEIPIKLMYDTFIAALADEFDDLPFDVTEENIQARVRGTLLMALSNKFGTLVLTTGNKSEMGVGYATLYGDMAGGFGVLKDVPKTLVYRLSDYRNSLGAVIPERVITRAPSAELRPNQTDQNSLPPYDQLDGIMELYAEQDKSAREIIALGFRPEHVVRVVGMIDRAEYKRRQAPIGIRITTRGFGKDRRYPITNKFRA
jgi:NAD+ synthetase